MFKKLFKKIHILHNIYIKHKAFKKLDSYSMEKEDIEIVKYLGNISNGFYVDVGCYHPLHLNNCYLLFKAGWTGINIDLSEFSIDLFNYCRPNDININCAVTNTDGKINYFYQKKLSQLTTINKDIAEERMQGVIKKNEINSRTLTSILDESRFKNRRIDFLNIDIEGADYKALLSLDFNKYRPKIICIEITEVVKTSKIYNFLKEKNYDLNWSSNSKMSHIFLDNNSNNN